MRVLLVEDDPDSASSLAALLQRHGHRVRYVTSGAEALGAAEQDSPEAALVDIIMPDLDGLAVIRNLREKFPELVIVAHSGWCRDQDQAAALAAGADTFVKKPAPYQVIEQAITAGRRT